jgi:hypothetical protein
MTDYGPITSGGATPKGGKQTSGKTIHARKGGMNVAGKGENTSDLPK